MDLKHTLETDEGNYEVYVNASKDDLDYLHRLSLMYLIEQGMFPFRLLTSADACAFHNTPEQIQ